MDIYHDAEITEHFCKKHKCNLLEQDCTNCEDGYSEHDCGEDCCCCLDPENNVICDWCAGKKFIRWYPKNKKENPCSQNDWELDTMDYD